MNKIKEKIKALAVKAVGDYSLIQLDAKEKREQKRKRDKELQELRESVACPHCRTRYSASQYYKGKTKKEDISIEEEHCSVHFNFLECSKCGELFGVKDTYFYGIGCDTIRNSFKLKDKDDG